MDKFLEILSDLPFWLLLIFFLVENILIMIAVLALGNILQRRPDVLKVSSELLQIKPDKKMFSYSRKQWTIALFTCVLNAAVTYTGFLLWEQGYIQISTVFSWRMIPDALFLFLAMDLLMYVFHYFIHQTFVYKMVHKLHHEAIDPEPIDLFILHPLETLSFGSLWLILLMAFFFNVYGVFIYLVMNVLFGMAGHLGMEPIPEKIRQLLVFKYLGTSTFHHGHHKNEQYNFGFYTSIWDRIFGTFKKSV